MNAELDAGACRSACLSVSAVKHPEAQKTAMAFTCLAEKLKGEDGKAIVLAKVAIIQIKADISAL